MFILSSTPLEQIDLRKDFTASSAGAFNCFEGWVRDVNDGKKVTALEYDAYESLCKAEAQKIFSEAQSKFEIIAVRAYHRVGKLSIGEMAVWVGVTARHRDECFKACRYIIDEVKSRLPIWKKEYYVSGESDWVNCGACASHQ